MSTRTFAIENADLAEANDAASGKRGVFQERSQRVENISQCQGVDNFSAEFFSKPVEIGVKYH